MRGQIWCIFGFSSSQKVWLMRVYGLREVWVKRGLTVLKSEQVDCEVADAMVPENMFSVNSQINTIIRWIPTLHRKHKHLQ
jgi:hypothetical protein